MNAHSSSSTASAGDLLEINQEDDISDVVTLMQQFIRNACVNDGRVESGQEYRSVATLKAYLQHPKLNVESFEAAPGRESLVATLKGSDPDWPSLGLLCHLDVVPVLHAAKWTHPPFSGEIHDGFIWGRGAVDMLYLTSSMSAALLRIAQSGIQPKGDLVLIAVADEEAGGRGARWLVENVPEKVVTKYVVTEWGGIPIPMESGKKMWITTGQKGGTDVRLQFSGQSAHASQPYGSDNALVKAAIAVQRLAEYTTPVVISDHWRSHVEAMGYSDELAAALLDPARIDDALDQLSPRLAARAHACTRMTISPTVVRGNEKSNVIPDAIELRVLVRRIHGQSLDDVKHVVLDALGDLASECDMDIQMETPPSVSPTHTPLWKALETASAELVLGSSCVPAITPGGNDGGFFRDRGSIVYGYGIVSPRITFDEYSRMMHGTNERMDIDSLALAVQLWMRTARELLFVDSDRLPSS